MESSSCKASATPSEKAVVLCTLNKSLKKPVSALGFTLNKLSISESFKVFLRLDLPFFKVLNKLPATNASDPTPMPPNIVPCA